MCSNVYSIYIKNYIDSSGNYNTNETLVYSVPMDPGEENAFIDPKVTGDMGKAGSFEFGMNAGHPFYERLCQMKTIFRVLYDGDQIFRGRVLTIDSSPMTGLKQVHCEGDLAFLLDSQIEGAPDNERGKTSAITYMTSLLSQHNSQMNEEGTNDKKFVLGEVPGNYTEATEAPQRVNPDANYRYGSGSWRDSQSAWNDLTNSFGGFVRTRYQNGTCYLDWIDNYYRSGVNEQTIEIGENILDLSVNSEVNNIFTAVIPVGSKDSKNIYINGYQTLVHGNNNRILVPDILKVFSDAQLNQGFHSKEDYQNAVRDYGIIYHTEAFPNAETQAQLWEYATDWIKNNYIGGLNSFSIGALDMHVIGESNGKFLVGDKVHVIYPDVNGRDTDPEAVIYKTMTLMGATYDLYHPEKNTYKIGVPNAILKRNYGEKKNKKSRSTPLSSQLSGLGDDLSKAVEEEWEDIDKVYDDATIWASLLDGLHDVHGNIKDQEYQSLIDTYGKDLVQGTQKIAEEWLYAEMNGEESEYGSLTDFLSGSFSNNATIRDLGQSGRKLLKWWLVRAGNHNLPIWTKTKVTEYGSVTEIISATYAYPAVYHARNGLPANIRKSASASSTKIGEVPNNSTVWCRSNPSEFTGTWMPIQHGNKFGYIQAKYLVQCTGQYDQGEGYPQLQETEKEEKTSVAVSADSLLHKITSSEIDLTDPEQITQVVQDEMLAKINMAGKDGEIKMGDGINWLINFLGEDSKLELGDGVNTLLSIFGMNQNGDSTSGLEFFKSLGPEVGQKILTAFTNGDTGTQTAVKAFFGGDDFNGINDLLNNLGIAPIKIDGFAKTIEVGTGLSQDSATVKLVGDNGHGQGQQWVGRKPNGDWRIFLNDNVSYKDVDGNDQNAYGFVTADDFKIKDVYNSLKSKLIVADTIVSGLVETAELYALKADIEEVYAKKLDVEGMLTATSLFSGDIFTGQLNVTGNGVDNLGINVTGKINATKIVATNVEATNSFKAKNFIIETKDADDQVTSTTYADRLVKVGSKQIEGVYVLANTALALPNVITSIEAAAETEDGKIGFNYYTYENDTAHPVNFNIADTAYYKGRVGIKSASATSGDIEDWQYWDEAVTFNGTDLSVSSVYNLIEVLGNNDGETKNKYSIRVNASGVLSEENVKATQTYLNDVGIDSIATTVISGNWRDWSEDWDIPSAQQKTLSDQYGKVTVAANDGTSYVFGIDASDVYEAGVREGEGNVDADAAYTSGYRTGYSKAQTVTENDDPRVSAYVDDVIYDNYTNYAASINKLQISLKAYPKLKFKKLQNDSESIEPDSWDATPTDGTLWQDTVEFPMTVSPVELYKESFDGSKFVVKAVGSTGWVKINGEEIDVPLKDPLNIPVSAEIYPTSVFKWNTEEGPNQYKYTFVTKGVVKSNNDTLIDLKQEDNVLDPSFAVNLGKSKMGVTGTWTKNVFSYSVVESTKKSGTFTITSYPSFEYDSKNHVYKLSSSSFNGDTKIDGSSPTVEISTGDTAYQDGLTQGRSESQTVYGKITDIALRKYGGKEYLYDEDKIEYTVYLRAIGTNLDVTANPDGGFNDSVKVDAETAFEKGRELGRSEVTPVTVYGKITGITQQRDAYYNESKNQYSVYARATGTGLDPTQHPNGYYDQILQFTPTGAYEAGQRSVHVTAASIVANLDVYTGDYSDIPVDVTLDDDPTTKKTINVDMRPIYQDGLDGKPEITNQEFEFEFVDDDGAYVVVDDPYFSINVNKVWKNGERDKTAPSPYGYAFLYLRGATKIGFYKAMPFTTSNAWGYLKLNNEVEFVDDKIYKEDGTNFRKVKFDGFVGYLSVNFIYETYPNPTGRYAGWYNNERPVPKITSVTVDWMKHDAYSYNGNLAVRATTSKPVLTTTYSSEGVYNYSSISTTSGVVISNYLKQTAYTGYYGTHSNKVVNTEVAHKVRLKVEYDFGDPKYIVVEVSSKNVAPSETIISTNIYHSDEEYTGSISVGNLGTSEAIRYMAFDALELTAGENISSYYSGSFTHSSSKYSGSLHHKAQITLLDEFGNSRIVTVACTSTAKAPTISSVNLINAYHSSSGTYGYRDYIEVSTSRGTITSAPASSYDSITTTGEYSSYFTGNPSYAYNADYPSILYTKFEIEVVYSDDTPTKTVIVEGAASRKADPGPVVTKYELEQLIHDGGKVSEPVRVYVYMKNSGHHGYFTSVNKGNINWIGNITDQTMSTYFNVVATKSGVNYYGSWKKSSYPNITQPVIAHRAQIHITEVYKNTGQLVRDMGTQIVPITSLGE